MLGCFLIPVGLRIFIFTLFYSILSKASIMAKLFRLLLVVGLCCAPTGYCAAQSEGGIPDEELLNRFGLTMAWWGRAEIDGKRDTVLHVTADEQNMYVQSSSGIITAFHGETGRQLWSGLVGAPDQRGFPATSNDEELLITGGMQIYSFNKNTGELLWQLRSPESPSTSPSLNNEMISIGAVDGTVFTFDLNKVRELHEERMLPQWTTLAKKWRFKTPQTVVSPPIFAGTTIVFASERGIVYGLSAENKVFKFQFETDSTIHTPLGSSRELIFVVDDDSRMFCLNKENGRIRWKFSSGAPVKQQPRVVGEQVFVIPTREGMTALTTVSGRVLWTQKSATEFITASETRVYASDISGSLLILDRENGRMIGRVPMRQFSNRINNERTDRIYLADPSGLVLGLRELGSEFPAYHRYPERRPILPSLAPEEPSEETPPSPAAEPPAVNPFQ